MTRLVYLDASALVKLAWPEPESGALDTFLTAVASRVTSIVGRIELQRVLGRLRSGDADVDVRVPEIEEILAGIDVLPLRVEVVRLAERIGPSTLRSLDAIHLAAVAILQPVEPLLVSYDRRLIEAADLLGIETASPA